MGRGAGARGTTSGRPNAFAPDLNRSRLCRFDRGGGTLGLIHLADRTPARFSSDDVALLERLADNITTALSNVLSQEARAAADRRYRTTLDAMKDAIHVVDRDLHILLANAALTEWVRRFGLDADVVGRTVFEAFPFLPVAIRDEYRRVFETGEVVITEERIDLEGCAVHTETRKIPVFEDERVTRAVTVLRDITPRKTIEHELVTALEDKEALLREVHHRVKNNLQVIASLLSLQSNAIRDKRAQEVFRESWRRVRSMGRLHDQLCQSGDLAHIDMNEYLRDLATHMDEAYGASGIRQVFDIAPVAVDMDTAMLCGLIVNELYSNALKHAFPEHAAGEVCVRLAFADDEHLELTVRDDGVGLPEGIDLESARTLGLRVVALLIAQLEGRVEVDRRAGTAFRITFLPRRLRRADDERDANPCR